MAASFAKMIADTAERAMAGRMRVERSEIVTKVLEALVVDVLERDPRFHRNASFYSLAARKESDELARRRQEEVVAQAASAGEWHGDVEPVIGVLTEPVTQLLPAGLPRATPLRDGDAA